MTPLGWVATALCWVALLPSGLRWLRVAQREHYLAGATLRFARRWWLETPVNRLPGALGVAGVALSWPYPGAALATALVATTGPFGLSVRGRTSPLSWTRRLRTLGAVWTVLEAAIVLSGFAVGRGPFFAALAVALSPAVVDLACLLTAPFERRVASRYVRAAAARLGVVGPRVVAITGSFGKTSTKHYLAHLLEGRLRVVASPASFNNRAGLARAVNENLTPGTEVFVAEMGTYGRGEIAELCRWCPPEVAVITAIGPVHLERFGSEDAILEAKSEITEGARTVVVNVDDQRLAALSARLAARHDPPRLIGCSAHDPTADVRVCLDRGFAVVSVGGEAVATGVPVGPGIQATNLACALGACMGLGVPVAEVVERVASLPAVAHRLVLGTAASGVVVIDDTFNSNPAGSRAALEVLATTSERRRVVVTPGMVELGPRQAEENRAFARASLEVATELIVVGRTNREALMVPGGNGRVIGLRTRQDAVRWVREHLGAGDAVLYENDLPDHYP